MRWLAWVAAVLLVAGGVAFGLLVPGSVAYFVAPMALVPIGYLAAVTFEDRWAAATRRARVLVWLAAAVLAAAGGAWYALAPGDGSFVVGVMMAMPVLVITPLLDRGARDDGRAAAAGGAEPFGPP